MFGMIATKALGYGIGQLSKKKKKKNRRGAGGLGLLDDTGPVLFPDLTMPPGGGVLAPGRAGGGTVAGRNGAVTVKSVNLEQNPITGEITEKPKRRRRRRLLTCSDRADIAFITGVLGKGQSGQAAIATLLARCN
jgi:hypothetical protein